MGLISLFLGSLGAASIASAIVKPFALKLQLLREFAIYPFIGAFGLAGFLTLSRAVTVYDSAKVTAFFWAVRCFPGVFTRAASLLGHTEKLG